MATAFARTVLAIEAAACLIAVSLAVGALTLVVLLLVDASSLAWGAFFASIPLALRSAVALPHGPRVGSALLGCAVGLFLAACGYAIIYAYASGMD